MARTAWNKLEPEEARKRRLARCAAYKNKHREELKSKALKNYADNREKFLQRKRDDYKKFKESRLKASKQYEKDNRAKVNLVKNAWRKRAKKERPEVKIKINLRERLRFAVKSGGGTKRHKALSIIGCSVADLMSHLQSKFRDGMAWNNYGPKGWHIDHIRPCASFDMLDPEQQKECFHYTNLQPLWASENLKKQDRMPNGEFGRNIKTVKL